MFDTFYSRMYNLSMRILANHHDAEDVLVSSFTRIFDHLARFEYRNEFSLSKWIRTIVINEAIRLINSRNQLQYSDDLATYETGLDSEYEAEGIDPEHIYSIIENMPAGYRIVFNLFSLIFKSSEISLCEYPSIANRLNTIL
ncbi:MAG TPA: sigma factor [Bacteroidales bacterium]|nr:sigma factor [Bacteroidales bacterium]